MNLNKIQGNYTHLALLVAVGEKLKAICSNGQELGVGFLQQWHHPLQAISQTYGHLGPLLVQKQVVECGDGVEQHRL